MNGFFSPSPRRAPGATGSVPALLLALLLGLLGSPDGRAQDTAPAAAPAADGAEPAPDGMVDVQFPNTPIPTILTFYEDITGTRVIRDIAVQDKNLSVQTSGRMTKAEAADFIEKSLLLNGYAILPTEKPDQRKIIAYNTDKKPSSEGIPVFTSPFQLPESDEVVTYIMPLAHITPEDAAELFTNVVVLHPYGKITPLKSASAIVVTESASVVRRLVEIRDHVDVSPIRTVDRAFDLERADAEDVVEALNDILGLGQEQSGGGAAPVPGRGDQAPVPAAAPASADGPGLLSGARGSADFPRPAAPTPRIRAIPRANRILVVATPDDMEYIESIVRHLDAPVETATYLRRQLHYISVGDVLRIAGDVILRGLGEDGQGANISGGDQQDGNNNNNQAGFANNNQNGFNDPSGLGNSGRGGGATGDLGNAGSDQAAAPQSVVIDKTLLIADNVQNMLIASGPPENLRRISELLDTMDVRPVQIQISAVISQLTLGDNYEFALNFLRTLEQPADGSFANVGGTMISRTPERLFDLRRLANPAEIGTATTGFNVYGQINKYLDMHLKALETTNRFKVLSRPTIYTVNNRQAVIETGERIAVPRSTLSSLNPIGNNPNQVVTANIDFENVVLRIAVVPLINANGEITLQIQQKNDSITGSTVIGGDSIPTIGTQSLGTTVMVPDGGTVLLGGLISEDDGKNQAGAPLFVNWPLLGRVFGSTQDRLNRRELLIFIQPKVIRDEFDHRLVDTDLKDRTQVGLPAEEFAENTDNNLEVFESQDFNSAEKRVFFFRDLFKKKPSVRAVPVEE